MNNMNWLKGVGTGMLLGACVGFAVTPRKKRAKKAFNKAIDAAGNIVEDISDLMGLS